MSPEVETLGAEGNDELAELFEETLPGSFDRETLARQWDVPGTVALVLRQKGRLLSGLLLRRVLDEAEILMLGSRVRRAGHASQLLELARQRLAADAVERLFLEVAADNASAIALYERVGFRQVGRRPSYYRSGADALLYELRVR